MDSDILTEVSSADLSLISNNVDESSDVVGLHVLATDFVHDPDNVMGELAVDECSQNAITIPTLTSGIQGAVIENNGEITLNSAFIPENAVLMETPRGLMLTVPQNMAGISYCDDSSPNEQSQHVLSCIPVSLFSTCDNSVDVDATNVYDGEVSNESHLGDDSEEIAKQLQEDAEGVPMQLNEDDGNGEASGKKILEQPMPVIEETTEVCKKKGGWPKGKRRKIKPTFTGPRAPVTGYVLYAMDRRKEIKESHPDITFPEVTKILGQEWSSMAPEVKDKYLAAADEDKKRYREELKAFKSSETYQETVRKKLMMTADGDMSSIQESSDILNCDEEVSNELYCKVCQVYFSTLHNKREHMYGKAHIQNVTDEVEKKLLQQQREEQTFFDGSLVVSEEMSQDGFSTTLRGNGHSCGSSSCSSRSCIASATSGPVDIHSFMMEFIQKNYEREQEISVLKKCLNKALQDNVSMCKEIQALQEYQNLLEEEIKVLTTATSSLIVQSDALKMVPTLFGIINL